MIYDYTFLLKSATCVSLEARDTVVLNTDWPVQYWSTWLILQILLTYMASFVLVISILYSRKCNNILPVTLL